MPYSMTTKWRLQVRGSDHVKVTNLFLYPELDCSACVDDVYDCDGAEQLHYYCDYLQRAYDGRYRPWWEEDAVPIYWSVVGDHDGFGGETAPCEANRRLFSKSCKHEDFLTFYHTPTNPKTGEPINWFKLPVINRRFPKFAKALGWLPAPFQSHAPLRSIVEGKP